MSALMSVFMSLPRGTRQRIWDKAMKEGRKVTDTMRKYPELYKGAAGE